MPKKALSPTNARKNGTSWFPKENATSCVLLPTNEGNGTMRHRRTMRHCRRQIVRQEMPAAERDGVAWHAPAVAVRAAKFLLGVAILFYLPPPPWLPPPSTVETKNESCARWALDSSCAGGTPYHVEISYPGTRESAVQGEPQESDTPSCKKATHEDAHDYIPRDG